MPALTAQAQFKGRSEKEPLVSTRTTRLWAKQDEGDAPTLTSKASMSLLAKGFRSGSNKAKKDKETDHAGDAGPSTSTNKSTYSEGLKVRLEAEYKDHDADGRVAQAFLRIRPPPTGSTSAYTAPYLDAQSDTEVIMRPPLVRFPNVVAWQLRFLAYAD